MEYSRREIGGKFPEVIETDTASRATVHVGWEKRIFQRRSRPIGAAKISLVSLASPNVVVLLAKHGFFPTTYVHPGPAGELNVGAPVLKKNP